MTENTNFFSKLSSIILKLFNPLKSILEDPLYVSLKNYNVVQVSGIAVSFYAMFYLLDIYKTNVDTLSMESATGIFGLAGIIFTTIWVQLNSIYNNSKS